MKACNGRECDVTLFELIKCAELLMGVVLEIFYCDMEFQG